MSEQTSKSGSIAHLSLENILPPGTLLAIHRPLGVAAILVCDEHRPQMQAAAFFPPTEMMVLSPLLAWFPDYCPNEALLASFAGGTSQEDVERARVRLHRAKERGEWDALMRPLRNALSRVRGKLNRLGIDVRSIFETGYLLRPYTEQQVRRFRRI
jgi:hypothetical protein